MSLLDRIEHTEEPSMNNHKFSAVMYFLARGEVTRENAITALGIQASEEVRFDEYKTYYDGSFPALKREFHDRVEASGILLENKTITQAFYKTLFGMT